MAGKKKGWTVSTNIKANPGSQGTLFQGGSEQMSDRRFPRGYSPERLNEVRDNIKPQPIPYYISDKAGTGPERRDMIATVARSTVPIEHLQGVQFYPGQLGLGNQAGKVAGQYKEAKEIVRSGSISDNVGKSTTERKPAEIAIAKGSERGSTTIHEIGHHVSSLQATEHSDYDTPEKKGREEGFADVYAHVHFRDRRGKTERPDVYAGGYSRVGHEKAGRTPEFFDEYHQVRQAHDPSFGRNLIREEEARDPETYEHYHQQGWQQMPMIAKDTARLNWRGEARMRDVAFPNDPDKFGKGVAP